MKTVLFAFVVFLILVSFFITPQMATAVNLDMQNQAPSLSFLFGSDDLGRSVFFRCLYGLKISFFVGCSATIIDMIFGALFGILSSSAKPSINLVMTRFLDVMTTLPQMLLSILVVSVLKSGILSLVIAISLTGWIQTARAMRLEMLKLKKMDYVRTLKGFGFTNRMILFKHLIPQALPTLLVSTAICLPQAIFSEAFMSFLGLGVPPPIPSLGNMVSDALSSLSYYPWRLLFPASIIFVVILTLHMAIDKLKARFRYAL